MSTEGMHARRLSSSEKSWTRRVAHMLVRGPNRPVWKHGPRSPDAFASSRVSRNRVRRNINYCTTSSSSLQHYDPCTDRAASMIVGTRKMVNYTEVL